MNNLSGSAVNRRLKCMEEIDNNLAEMEDFSGKDIYLKTFFLYTKALYTVNILCQRINLTIFRYPVLLIARICSSSDRYM